jgi:hypothetical protein
MAGAVTGVPARDRYRGDEAEKVTRSEAVQREERVGVEDEAKE